MLESQAAYSIGVVGATGAVGRAMVEILHEREFPIDELRLFASERSRGEAVEFGHREVPVDVLEPERFEGLDLALFSAGAEVSRAMAPEAAKRGCVVIDNSSAWRQDPRVPLVVPEVNAFHLADFEARGIVANPNCSTIQLVVVLKPLADLFGLRRVVVSTYQSVSGAGQRGVEELATQVRNLLNGLPVTPSAHPYQIAFNCIPQIGEFRDDGYTTEEWKLVAETQRILDMPDLEVCPTAVRVPVFSGHSESVTIETEEPLSVEQAQAVLAAAPGVRLLDEPSARLYPMPFPATGRDEVHVGRIRRDPFRDDTLLMWICADNLRKGAALNAVQIAERLVEDYT